MKGFFLWILLSAFGMISVARVAAVDEIKLYDAKGKRDPFIPLVTPTTKVTSGLLTIESIDDIVVEGIVYDPPKGSVVIANGSVMREGEEVGVTKVIGIRPNGAVFSIGGTEAFKPLYAQPEEMEKGKAG
ncbi:MAG: hypothetical protein HY593_02175 [Candidatus Omnitrophica bacterium]|nr:hypothetical protein [Candidatus Omnitrophota bacterium]